MITVIKPLTAIHSRVMTTITTTTAAWTVTITITKNKHHNNSCNSNTSICNNNNSNNNNNNSIQNHETLLLGGPFQSETPNSKALLNPQRGAGIEPVYRARIEPL